MGSAPWTPPGGVPAASPEVSAVCSLMTPSTTPSFCLAAHPASTPIVCIHSGFSGETWRNQSANSASSDETGRNQSAKTHLLERARRSADPDPPLSTLSERGLKQPWWQTSCSEPETPACRNHSAASKLPLTGGERLYKQHSEATRSAKC